MWKPAGERVVVPVFEEVWFLGPRVGAHPVEDIQAFPRGGTGVRTMKHD